MGIEEETTRRVREALDKHLRPALAAFVSEKMESRYGQNWLQNASRAGGSSTGRLDAYGLLKTMRDHWLEVFSDAFDPNSRDRAKDFMYAALKARNDLAHLVGELEDDDALRHLNALHQLAKCVGAPAEVTAALKRLYDEQRAAGLTFAPKLPSPSRVAPPFSKRIGSARWTDFRHYLMTGLSEGGANQPLSMGSARCYCTYISGIESALKVNLDDEYLTEDGVGAIENRLRALQYSGDISDKTRSNWVSGLRAYARYKRAAEIP